MGDAVQDPEIKGTAGGDKYEPPQDEQDAVKHWLQRIKRAEEEPKRKAWFGLLEKLRSYVYGTKHDDATGQELTRTNLVFATLAAMVPRVYAKNPDIGVTPTTACSKDKLAMIKKFGATAETVLAQMFIKEPRLKQRAKANVRAAMTTSYGVLKMVFQKELQGDPLVIRRIQDTQDNLAKVELLVKNLKDGDDVTAIAQQREELNAQLTGLRSGNEIKIFKGFVIDRVRSEDFLILDDSIAEFDEYVDAAALGHVVWMTVTDYEAKFGHKPETATKYNTPFATETGAAKEGQGIGDMFVCVVEIWDKSSGAVRTVAKGSNRWCRAPYAPENLPQRWYPFYVLGFNLVEGRWRPLSDVELMMGLQDEYNTTRTNYADARKDSVPVRVFRKAGALTPEDIEALSVKRRNRDWIGIEGSPTQPISQDIMQMPGVTIDPAAYDTSVIDNDINRVSGTSDADRADIGKAKTATEAGIMQANVGSRVDERRDTNEDLITDMATAALEILLRGLTKDEVKQLAGDDAEWPEMTVDQIFALVEVNVRAGSSGKPNADKEREQWTQLLPVIEKAMQTVMELRQAGHYDMADSAVELLRETLRRFQERVDVDSLIPPLERGPDGKPVAQAQAAEQLAQMQQQFQEIQKALQDCQQQLQKAQAGEQSKVAAEQTKQQQAANDAQRAQEQAAADERLRSQEIDKKDAFERDKMAMDERVAKEKIAAEQATKITVARIAAGAKSPEEEQAAQDSAANVAAEQQEALRLERAAADERFNQTHEAILGMGQSLQQGLAHMADLAGADREVVPGPDGMPVGMRIKRPALQ